MGTLVFDIDDTICVHKNRDYANARPIQEMIDKINQLYDRGYEIVLYTSRGMNSCKGDLDLIIKKNKDVLEKWLKDNNVSYTKLIFGKPLGDWYIDDKAMTMSQFLNAPFYDMKGGSKASIRREGDRVIKTSPSSKMQYMWFNAVKDSTYIRVPKIYGITLDSLYMEYVEENRPCETVPIDHIINIIDRIKKTKQETFSLSCNIKSYCDNILKHIDEEWTRNLCSTIMLLEKEFKSRMSFCHGDITLSNCLCTNEFPYICLIDPNFKDDYNSYIVDLSKLRMSLNGFELYLGRFKNDYSVQKETYCIESLKRLDNLISKEDLYLVKLLEVANWVRLHNFREGDEQAYAYRRARELWKELQKETCHWLDISCR